MITCPVRVPGVAVKVAVDNTVFPYHADSSGRVVSVRSPSSQSSSSNTSPEVGAASSKPTNKEIRKFFTAFICILQLERRQFTTFASFVSTQFRKMPIQCLHFRNQSRVWMPNCAFEWRCDSHC